MPNKSLGQHWLHDRFILEAIADCAAISQKDVVLEIGPGLGTLTSVLLARASRVIAVEFDESLAAKLPKQFPGKNLTVVNEDILSFDLSQLPAQYTVVANVPYYITSKIIQLLSETSNPPKTTVLLVQKEVAERIVSPKGASSTLSVAAQVFHEVSLGPVVAAEYFTPPPKVDSQVVVMKRRANPLIDQSQQKSFFKLVRAGFSERRKKLRSSLAGSLSVSKDSIDSALKHAGIPPDARAQELTIEQWKKLQDIIGI